MKHYGMVIDLKLCINCNACTMACKAAHGTQPGVFWNKVLEKESGKYPNVTRLFIPVLCNHCREPLCETVCPTGATYKSEDGLVLVDYEKCIGCKACISACPYGVRTYVDRERFYFPNTPIPYNVDELRGIEGVVQKCTFCSNRLKAGEEPACVEVCPPSCRVFGDLNDPESEVWQMIRSRNAFQLLPDKGTDPSVFYIR
ncbi:MAG TPA: 4Fe-4S dicluster domain-containing protein [Deltaproteobacteria bacterium]|jgi:molybdopterin-containing oxidoreductase family iron-sulfur binding subunit|nr:4Fe-4S dicluster domain-containing protein [Deltaproteobacteria bacterium]HQJ08650.1 4Fe-4S dicluster domain-containing protein [Deltaproteobacteria bacterium]